MPQDHPDRGTGGDSRGQDCTAAYQDCDNCCLFEQCECFELVSGWDKGTCASQEPEDAARCSTGSDSESAMPFSVALIAQHKDQLLLLLLASNLALLAYICGARAACKKKQYAKVDLDSEDEFAKKELL